MKAKVAGKAGIRISRTCFVRLSSVEHGAGGMEHGACFVRLSSVERGVSDPEMFLF